MTTPAATWFVIVLTVVGAPGLARAQASPSQPVQPAPDPNAPRIAPPAPEASPQDVEKRVTDGQD